VTNVLELTLPAKLVNKAQAQRWNGRSGRYWIKHRDRHLAEEQDLTPDLFKVAKISQGERVLDVGCGCGGTTIEAARAAIETSATRAATSLPHRDGAWPTPVAVGVDLSAPMLDVARRLATQSGTTNVEFVHGDAQVCSFPSNSFDIAISSFGVMFFDDPWAAFEHLVTFLRPGGRLAFLCWQDDKKEEVLGIPQRVFGAHLPSEPNVNKLFFYPSEIENLLTKCGWKVTDIREVSGRARMGSDVDDVMSYIRGMPSTQDLANSFEDQALEEKLLAEVKAEYTKRQLSDGVWVRAAAWLVTARCPDLSPTRPLLAPFQLSAPVDVVSPVGLPPEGARHGHCFKSDRAASSSLDPGRNAVFSPAFRPDGFAFPASIWTSCPDVLRHEVSSLEPVRYLP
jgi:ubiquinone/menaquinone biosynthesis C-methylase UbiE